MIEILKKIYFFSPAQKKNIVWSIVLGIVQSLFELMQLGAIYMMFQLLTGGHSDNAAGISQSLYVSVIGTSV